MLRRQSIFRRIKVTHLYATVFKCVSERLGLVVMAIFLYQRALGVTSQSDTLSLFLSLCQSF